MKNMSNQKIPIQIRDVEFGKKEKISLGVCLFLASIMLAKLGNIFGFGKFIDSLVTVEHQTIFLFGLIGLIFASLLIFVTYGFIQVIKNEREMIKYEPSIGDSVSFSGHNRSFDGEIVDSDDKYVTVQVKLYKGAVYPNKDK